jgi:hypothetical protein
MVKLSPQGFAEALRKYDRGTKLWRGAPHTAKQLSWLCVARPSHIYIGGGRGEKPRGAPSRPNPTWGPPQFGPPTIFAGGKRKGGKRKGRGRPTPPPSFLLPTWPAAWEGCASPLWAGVLLPFGPYGPLISQGVWNPFRCPDDYPVHSETFLVSEYHRPIYQSLPPDHSGAPRHARDLIRDSEQHSVTKPHNSYNTKLTSNVKRADPTGSRMMWT